MSLVLHFNSNAYTITYVMLLEKFQAFKTYNDVEDPSANVIRVVESVSDMDAVGDTDEWVRSD